MHTDILSELSDREVEITTSCGAHFKGMLIHQVDKGIVIVRPITEYASRRWGPTYIKQNDIVSIREILPHIDDDDEDCCEKSD